MISSIKERLALDGKRKVAVPNDSRVQSSVESKSEKRMDFEWQRLFTSGITGHDYVGENTEC